MDDADLFRWSSTGDAEDGSHGQDNKKKRLELDEGWRESWTALDALMMQGKWDHTALCDTLVSQLDARLLNAVDEDLLPDLFCCMFSVCFAQHMNGQHQIAYNNVGNLFINKLQGQLNANQSNGLVIGNPLFHLLCAKLKLDLQFGLPKVQDEVIRCCSVGGVEMLKGEPAVLRELLKQLAPPAPFKSWEASDETLKTGRNSSWKEYPFSHMSDGTFVMDQLTKKWGVRQ